MRGRKIKTYSIRWVSFLVVIMFLFGTFTGGAYALYSTQLFAEQSVDEDGNVIQGVQKNNINDPTANLNDQDDDSYNFLFVGVDESELLTDVIMLINMDMKTKKITVLQIPRDTYIGEEESGSGTGKINAIYSHPDRGKTKIETLVSYINHKFKVSVDYYATIDIEGFKKVVDIIGGVTVDVPQDVVYDGKVAIPAGVQVLNGEQSEWFIRFRKGYYDGDIGRQKAQVNFLMGLLDEMFQVSAKQAANIASQCISMVTTNMTVSDMMQFYNDVLKIGKDSVEFTRVPGEGVNNWGPTRQSVYGVYTEELAEILDQSFRPNSPSVPAKELGLMDYYDMAAKISSYSASDYYSYDDDSDDNSSEYDEEDEVYTSSNYGSSNKTESKEALGGNPGPEYSSQSTSSGSALSPRN